MVVEIDKTRCVLCGVCEALAPHIFTQNIIVEIDQGAAQGSPDYLTLCQEACPMDCILV